MVYLKEFSLPTDEEELGRIDGRRIHNSTYPFGLFSSKELTNIVFDNITILAGNNGSGKTTLLNVIAEKLGAVRKNNIDKGTNFSNYVDCCQADMAFDIPLEIKLITSDDVFDYLLDIRAINTGINRRKELLTKEYLANKYGSHDNDFASYEEIKNDFEASHKTMSKYIRSRLVNNNIIEQSNGESSLMFWEKEINENSIYLLDEPENSLSAENQLKLKTFIEESARFYNCQFIISTHSPFLLALNEAKIYDLDAIPVNIKKWENLPNVKTYYNFFKDREDNFK